MEPSEVRDVVSVILDDAATIIHNQQVLAGLHAHLVQRLLFPHEQAYIFRDHYGAMPVEPQRQVISGVTITTRILHNEGIGLRDIMGADLLYEIEGTKFVILQYKRVDNGRVRNDPAQLTELLNNCPDACPNKLQRALPELHPPLASAEFCGCWYAVMTHGSERLVHACQAEVQFNGQKSAKAACFDNGISNDEFTRRFAACELGALVRRLDGNSERAKRGYVRRLLDAKHLIFEVRQIGRWFSTPPR